MDYGLLKTVHVSCAAMSYLLFVLRGLWRFRGSTLAAQRWTKVVPHVNDSVLLLTAVPMATALLPYPAYHPFLVAKVSGVFLYILLGMTAFRWAKSRRPQVGAWLAAQAAFFHIVGVAVTKSPWPGLG